MGERTQHITPFQSGQTTTERDHTDTKVPVKFRMAKQRNAGQPDPLRQALIAPPRVFDDTQHFVHKKAVSPKGAHYNPAGEFGRPTGKMNSRATNYPSHTSRGGSNPLGSPQNRRGGNPLAHEEKY